MGTLGILISLALLMYLAYRGINVLILAPLLALLALLFAGDIGLLLPTYTQVFMKAMGGYVIQFFPLFLLGALFGKLMDDSGSARAIAQGIVAKVSSERDTLARMDFAPIVRQPKLTDARLLQPERIGLGQCLD